MRGKGGEGGYEGRRLRKEGDHSTGLLFFFGGSLGFGREES
jgi:hypothetical protein